MKNGVPWRERRKRRELRDRLIKPLRRPNHFTKQTKPIPAKATPPEPKGWRCYLVTLTDEYTPYDKHGIASPYYIVNETGEKKLWDDLAPGAIQMGGFGPYVKLPDGRGWHIDSRASNCTKPDDDKHKCWVRHGEAPNFTVDKDGLTCAAGGGSIATPGYHGFLRNGYLTPG